ncbi:glycosyl hydrolase family 28-related protein [Microbulbifer hydrolyticus]|uniref:Uncharacterized protein n=1 Tax=Microbulbifer hydrolyticus TaxID=48074 RepID=A0A6P1TFF3_9GAMM|nr:glycosyl hydrolase family 28-related protein [Microbulbifer hydrolyticus]MBB5213030.1 hypothetical protein [Microbulbifer hydrolyticus]QHQ40393.1 hypothetical protein GTQ55_16370 [Microbulbifer hydrolyticus]
MSADQLPVQDLPDFSYAGYKNGSAPLALEVLKSLDVTEFGAIPDDGVDDSRAFLAAFAAAEDSDGPVAVEIPAGRFIVSEILYLQRDNLILRGAGNQKTRLYFPRPLRLLPDPPELAELREYLTEMDKRQREKQNNIDLPFTQYAWAGGYIWARKPGERVKAYLDKYDTPVAAHAQPVAGERGKRWLTVKSAGQLEAGQVINVNWYNRAGRDSPLLKMLYPGVDKIGSHHWAFPSRPLVSQTSRILEIKGNRIELSDPLLHDIEGFTTDITRKPYLQNVGLEDFTIEFPASAYVAHHVEQGFNGIYLTRVYDGWVRNVDIINADSGVLTEEVANLTIRDVTTSGEHKAHYSVAMGDTHNVLVENLHVQNLVIHPLSFNTFSTKSVYTGCTVDQRPILDQHSGANHQNLFDNITMYVELNDQEISERRYSAFKGGGAGYWKPTHGADSTFWNIRLLFSGVPDEKATITLDGVADGPNANIYGVHGNRKVDIDYGPSADIAAVNQAISDQPSLYQLQLSKRRIKSRPTDNASDLSATTDNSVK